MIRRGLIALLACVAAGPAWPDAGAQPRGPGQVQVIDAVLAVVRSGTAEPRVLTRSRVEEETRIALVAHGGLRAATEPLDEAAMTAGLQALIDETLLGDDAARLQVFDSDADASDEALRAFRAQFVRPADYRAFLRRWALSEEEVAGVLRRKARVQRYVDSRVSHAAQVSEGEITAWLETHAAAIGGSRDRELARTRLAEQRVAAEVKAFVRDLRSRADVRILPRVD